MFPSDAAIMSFIAQYAHSPALIYTIVATMMFLSSFGGLLFLLFHYCGIHGSHE